jgi:hypothetical protein
MHRTKMCFARRVTAAVVLMTGLGAVARGETLAAAPAGQTVLTYVNRLYLTPPSDARLVGYFATIQGIQGSLFSGTPGENTAHFTWSFSNPGAMLLQNGDPAAPGSASVVVLPAGNTFNVYFNPAPNQSWSNPDSFSAGQLVASFRSVPGTDVTSGPAAVVANSLILVSSRDFAFRGRTYNFGRLIPHGFTNVSMHGSIPLTQPGTFPLVFAGGGSGIAIGGALSTLPRWF